MNEDREPRRDVPNEHEPGTDEQHKPKQSHAGNGTVNHRLDDQGPDGLDSDEQALRRLLHQAVDEIEPRGGTLDHLRQAVPARRARKRQALIGMAAAALFVGTAIPALVHVSGATGSDADPSMAGHYSQAQGGASEGKGPDGGESTSGGSSGQNADQGKGNQTGQSPGTDSGNTTGSTSTGPATSSTVGVPACTATELGSATANADAADSSGIVYGTFRYTNTSTSACTVTGPGSVFFATAGAADASKVTVSRHVSGDAAVSLPDPSTELASLVLQPGSSYDVKFAWVPSETCPTDNSTPDPTPDPTESTDTGSSEGSSSGGDTGTTTQLMTEGGTLDGSVSVTNSAEGGIASATTTVSNACAGTIYWTGVLAGS